MEEEDDSSALQKLLKDNKIDDSAKIDNKYTMHLDPKSNNKGVSDFLKAAKGKKIGNLKSSHCFIPRIWRRMDSQIWQVLSIVLR